MSHGEEISYTPPDLVDQIHEHADTALQTHMSRRTLLRTAVTGGTFAIVGLTGTQTTALAGGGSDEHTEPPRPSDVLHPEEKKIFDEDEARFGAQAGLLMRFIQPSLLTHYQADIIRPSESDRVILAQDRMPHVPYALHTQIVIGKTSVISGQISGNFTPDNDLTYSDIMLWTNSPDDSVFSFLSSPELPQVTNFIDPKTQTVKDTNLTPYTESIVAIPGYSQRYIHLAPIEGENESKTTREDIYGWTEQGQAAIIATTPDRTINIRIFEPGYIPDDIRLYLPPPTSATDHFQAV